MITPSFSLTATERVLPKLALDFTTASLDNRVTFTRALNTATVTNSNGYITAINADLPRFDYDPITLSCKGLLIEELRSNLTIQSENFSTSWTLAALNTTGTPPWLNVATSPANTLTADKLTESTATSTHDAYQTLTGTAASYTFSVYAKKSERFFMAMRLWNGSANSAFTFFNLNAGTVAFTSSGTATITAVGNGWYRCTVTAALTASASCQSIISICDDSANLSYTGNGTSGLFAWGAQLEVGAFATSYIPTTTATVTRNADVAVMTGTNFSSWFNQTQGAFEIELITPKQAGTRLLSATQTTSGFTPNNTIYIDNDSSIYRGIIFSGASGNGINISSQGAQGSTAKISFAYKLNSVAGSFNASTPATNNSIALPLVNCDFFQIGQLVNGLANINSHVKKINYWPQRLINAEVQAFTK